MVKKSPCTRCCVDFIMNIPYINYRSLTLTMEPNRGSAIIKIDKVPFKVVMSTIRSKSINAKISASKIEFFFKFFFFEGSRYTDVSIGNRVPIRYTATKCALSYLCSRFAQLWARVWVVHRHRRSNKALYSRRLGNRDQERIQGRRAKGAISPCVNKKGDLKVDQNAFFNTVL